MAVIYGCNGCGRIQARNELIESNLALVAPLARFLGKQIPPSFELADLIQSGTLGLIQAADSWDSEQIPFPMWAKLKIRGAMLDSVRRRAWREQAHEDLPETASAAPSPEAIAVFAERAGQLRQALEVLPPRERRLVVLHHVEGISYRAAGAAVGLGKTRARQLVEQAMQTLRLRLAS
jgi:RNA polymerase sigma factor (sigma-70 family)